MSKIQRILEARLAEKKPLVLSMLAEEAEMSEYDLARELPAEICVLAPGEEFERVWEELVSWPSALFFVNCPGAFIEISGPVPAGSRAMGFFNLREGSPLSGHIKTEEIKAIGFVSLPFMGMESYCVQFFHQSGSTAFAVYVGREKRVLIPEALESFRRLRKELCGV
jgi:putative heme utilization carrier protein HutX